MLTVAKVLKSFGTDGGVLVSSTVDLESLDFKEPVYIVFDGLQVPFFILDCQPKGARYILHLNDVGNLRDAEELVGKEILSDAECEGDEEDFTGWDIFDHGKKVGRCTGLEDIPGNPCLILETASGGEALIPLHEDFIVSADESSHSLYLELPKGLY